jgi:hypothetical protein
MALEASIFFYSHLILVPYSEVLSTSLCIVSFVLGLALLKWSRLAFWLAFGLQVFRFTNAVVMDLTPSAGRKRKGIFIKCSSGGKSGTSRRITLH